MTAIAEVNQTRRHHIVTN